MFDIEHRHDRLSREAPREISIQSLLTTTVALLLVVIVSVVFTTFRIRLLLPCSGEAQQKK